MKYLLFSFVYFLTATSIAQYNFSKVDSWLENNTPSMGGRTILAVYKDGRIIYTRSINEIRPGQRMAGKIIARRTGKNPDFSDFDLDTRLAIASCSKWLSAALVMTFVDEGKLHLTDTVGKFLPVLAKSGKGNITIGQCLSHLTAIKEPPLQQSLKEIRNIGSMDKAIEWLAGLPMEGTPGKVFHYSNAGLQIAGAVIEKISNKNFETLFSERIAWPLEMKNTDFGKGNVALPAGGAYSTPQDYLNFLTMILNKGTYKGKRILSEHSIIEMQINRITPDVQIAYSPSEAGDFGYGYGEWVMETSAKESISIAITSPGLFGSFPWVDNEKKYCAFLMAFYLKNQGRNQKYKELKQLVDKAIQ